MEGRQRGRGDDLGIRRFLRPNEGPSGTFHFWPLFGGSEVTVVVENGGSEVSTMVGDGGSEVPDGG